MGKLHDFLEDYDKRNPEFAALAKQRVGAFFADVPDVAVLSPINFSECDMEHPELAGVNMDIGQCPKCWMPMGVMRTYGESFGWHVDDCALPMRHAGYCERGGNGHVMPEGWKLRG